MSSILVLATGAVDFSHNLIVGRSADRKNHLAREDVMNVVFRETLCFYLIFVFILSFMDCAMLVMVWHLRVEGTITTLVRKCSLLDGS